MNINELKASAVSVNEKLQKVLLKGPNMTNEDLKEAQAFKDELDAIRSKVALVEGAEEAKNWLNSSAKPFTQPSEKEQVDVLNGVAQMKGISAKQLNAIRSQEYKSAFREFLMHKGAHSLSSDNYKTLQEGVDSNGGFLVPDFIQNELVSKKPAPTSIVDKVRKLTTSRDSLSVPTMDYDTDDLYTNPMRWTQTGEIPSSSTAHLATDPSFGMRKIEVNTQMISINISRDMLEDSMFPVEQLVAAKFAEVQRQQLELAIINKILENPGATGNPEVINLGTSIDPDRLIHMAYTLPPQYDANASFVFNKRNTGRGIAQLKDLNDRYLFGYGVQDSGLAGARPSSMLGYDITFSEFMPNAYTTNGASGNADAYPLIFGDLQSVWVVERSQVVIEKLDQIKALDNQIVLCGRWRYGVAVVHPWALKLGKVAAVS